MHTPEEEAEFEKEKKEHPEFSDDQIWEIVNDHKKVEGKSFKGPLSLIR